MRCEWSKSSNPVTKFLQYFNIRSYQIHINWVNWVHSILFRGIFFNLDDNINFSKFEKESRLEEKNRKIQHLDLLL